MSPKPGSIWWHLETIAIALFIVSGAITVGVVIGNYLGG